MEPTETGDLIRQFAARAAWASLILAKTSQGLASPLKVRTREHFAPGTQIKEAGESPSLTSPVSPEAPRGLTGQLWCGEVGRVGVRTFDSQLQTCHAPTGYPGPTWASTHQVLAPAWSLAPCTVWHLPGHSVPESSVSQTLVPCPAWPTAFSTRPTASPPAGFYFTDRSVQHSATPAGPWDSILALIQLGHQYGQTGILDVVNSFPTIHNSPCLAHHFATRPS